MVSLSRTGIELLGEMCRSELVGAGIGSSEITLVPHGIRAGHFTADTRTAGYVRTHLASCILILTGTNSTSRG